MRTMYFAIILVIVLFDSILSNVSDFLVTEISSNIGFLFYTFTIITYAVGQYLILSLLRSKDKPLLREKYLGLDIGVRIVQYILVAIGGITILQIIMASEYRTILLSFATALSYALNIMLLSFLVFKLSAWYNVNRASIVMLLYTLGFCINILSSVAAVVEDLDVLNGRELVIELGTQPVFPIPQPGTIHGNLSQLYHISSDLSFGLIWIATAMLMRQYRYKLGKLKFCILVTLPLLYYMSTSIDILGIYSPQTDSESFIFYIYSSINSSAGAIFFGISFWTWIKVLPKDNILKRYMKIVSYGLILLFVTSQASVLSASYPPFGMATVSFYGLSAYLVFLGLNLTAAALATDIKLRTMIRRIAIEQAKLLDNIGQSEAESQISDRVSDILKRQIGFMNEEEVQSLSPDQITRYVNQTVNEIRKIRK